jgi:RNA polymerase sigma-70 factor (ECF subfamily)
MSEGPSFTELIGRVRAGDGAAADELVRRFEPVLRRTIRVRLRDARLRRLLDTADVCQSVLANFFARAALGRYDLDTPEQLLQLLVVMARHKLANQARNQRAGRRDHRRTDDAPAEEHTLAAPDASPSRQAAARELLDEARRLLSAEELRLLELRQQGCGWPDVAAAVGGSPEALRKQLSRAVERVARQLGLEEIRDE